MAWIDELADALSVDRLSEPEADALLDVARDVAHRVERKVTPLSTFLLGAAVGDAVAGGGVRADALARARSTLAGLLPPEA